MTEAVTAVNDFAFKVIEMESLRLGNALPNIGSRKLKEQSGAVLVEIDPDVQFVGGIYPEEIWHLTPEEWFENRSAFLHRRDYRHSSKRTSSTNLNSPF